MKKVSVEAERSTDELLRALHKEAIDIYQEDLEMCRRLGANGAELLRDATFAEAVAKCRSLERGPRCV